MLAILGWLWIGWLGALLAIALIAVAGQILRRTERRRGQCAYTYRSSVDINRQGRSGKGVVADLVPLRFKNDIDQSLTRNQSDCH